MSALMMMETALGRWMYLVAHPCRCHNPLPPGSFAVPFHGLAFVSTIWQRTTDYSRRPQRQPFQEILAKGLHLTTVYMNRCDTLRARQVYVT